MVSEEPRHLVHRCAVDRGAEPWEEFVRRYGRRLNAGIERALVRSGVRARRVEREDLVQEVYCRLLERGGLRLLRCRAEDEHAVGGYLTRVAETVTIDRLRAAAAAKRGGRSVAPPGSLPDLFFAERLADPTGGPEERLLRRERRVEFFRRCRRAIGHRTPHRNLRVVYLALVEGWSSREISARLGRALAPSGIDTLLHRLRRRLGDEGARVSRRGRR